MKNSIVIEQPKRARSNTRGKNNKEKPQSLTNSEETEHIQVFLRMRPRIPKELSMGEEEIWKVTTNSVQLDMNMYNKLLKSRRIHYSSFNKILFFSMYMYIYIYIYMYIYIYI